MKKLIGIVLAIIISIGCVNMLYGCGKKTVYDPNNFIADTNSQKIVKEKVTIKVFTLKSAMHKQWEDMYLFKELENRTNIHMEFEEVTLGDVAQLKGLKWEDKDNPTDAFFLGNQPYEITQYSSLGALRELTGYDEITGNSEKNLLELYAPNYMEWMERYPEIKRVSSQVDGKIFSFASVNTLGGETATQYINKKWIDDLNLASMGTTYVGKSGLPETTTQFYNTLKAFKEYDANKNGNSGDEVPLIAATYDASLYFLTSAFGHVSTGIELDKREKIANASGELINNPNYNKIVWCPSTEEYRSYVKYINKLYTEGLLHDGLFTNGETNLTSLGSQGRLGSFTSSGSFFVVGNALDSQYVALPPLVSDSNRTQMAWQYKYQFDPSALIIPATTPYYREIIRWMDAFYDLNNEPLQSRGKEGEHWEVMPNAEETYDPIRDENLKRWRIKTPAGMAEEEYRATVTYQAGLGNPILYTIDSENSGDPYRIKMQEEREVYRPFMSTNLPQLSFTTSEMEDISALEDGLGTFMKNNFGKFVKGDINPNDNSKWADFLSNMQKFNYETLVNKYVSVYNRNFPDNKI